MKWTAADIPDLAGKKVLITGANSGLGFESARALAGHGAHVIMACRNPQKAESSAAAIRSEHAGASLELAQLDLSSLASIRAFAAGILHKHARLDVLLNNAGIMAVPYAKTADGFELQFGTNHLGHFALTGLLFELLRKTGGARVVNVSSQAHTMGKMRFDDLGWEHGYKKWSAYGMSKFAVRALAEALRMELAREGIAVTLISPGFIDSDIRRTDNRGVLHPHARDTVPAWLRMPTERAARAIVAAIHRRERERIITMHGKAAVLLYRYVPALIRLLQRRGIRPRPEPKT